MFQTTNQWLFVYSFIKIHETNFAWFLTWEDLGFQWHAVFPMSFGLPFGPHGAGATVLHSQADPSCRRPSTGPCLGDKWWEAESHHPFSNDKLVGGWPTHLKNMKVNWDDDIPNIWENKTCSKPPISESMLKARAWTRNVIQMKGHICSQPFHFEGRPVEII